MLCCWSTTWWRGGRDMGTARRILKNTTFVSAEVLFVNAVSFFFLVFVARRLGVTEFGRYAFAKAFLEILIVWADLGITKLLVRDVARRKDRLSEFLGDFLAIKLLLSAGTAAAGVLLVRALGYDPLVREVVYLLGTAYLIQSAGALVVSVFQGDERMEVGTLLSVLRSVLLVGTAVPLLLAGGGLLALCGCVLFAQAATLLTGWITLMRAFPGTRLRVRFGAWRRILREGAAFGLGSVFVRIFVRIDSVMLSKMAGMAVVGWYNASYNLILVLMFLPGALSQALFPVTSRYFATNRAKMREVFERSFKYAVLIGFPAATGLALLADRIILLLYHGGYRESIPALRVLAWTLALSSGTAMMGNLLGSADRQAATTWNMFICSLANVGMNLVLIPRFGLMGASAATLATEILLFGLTYTAVCRHLYAPPIWKAVGKAAGACAVMAAVVWGLRDRSMVVSVPLGAAVYIAAGLLVHAVDRRDWELLSRVLPVRG